MESGSIGGDGSRANSFATIEEGIATVSTSGIVHILGCLLCWGWR